MDKISSNHGNKLRKIPVACALALLLLLVASPLALAGESEGTVVYRIERTYDMNCTGSGHAEDVELHLYLFDNQTEWSGQRILEENIRTSGEQYSISSTSDNRYVIVRPERIGAGDTKTVTITQVVRVDSTDLDITASKVHGNIPLSYQKYTEPVDHLWQSDNNTIENKAVELTENESNYYSKAKRIFDYVQEHMIYIQQSEEHDALWAYNQGHGDCTDYANLFIALCRAAEIPAKFVAGHLYKADNNYLGPHGFSVIYLPNVGWVPVDATETLTGGGGHFAELTTEHLVRLVSDGSNLTGNSGMNIPSEWSWSGKEYGACALSVDESTSTSRVVAVEPSVFASDTIEDSIWKFTVQVKNVGSQDISNVEVELQVDETYFETPSAENLGTINTGTQKYARLDVPVKKSVENSPITTIINYETEGYGSLSSEETIPATTDLPQSAYKLPLSWTMIIIIILTIVSGLVIGAVALLRR